MSFGFGVGDFLAVLKIADKVRRAFVDAPGQLAAISDDVKRLSNILRDIDDNDPAASLGLSQQSTLNEISRGCQNVLYDVINKLAKYEDILNDDGGASGKSFRKSTRKVWNRLTFDQGEIDSYRRRIDSNVAAFELFLTEINSQLSRETNDIVTVTQAGVNQLVQAQDENHRREILSWLSPNTHDAKQADLFGRVQPGTGGWLLESDEYRRWDDQSHDGDQTVDMKKESDLRTLFCTGLPGSGKTFLSSIVVNELQRSGDPLAFFYCNFREKTNLDEILGILLRQLVQQQAVLPSALETLYEQHVELRTRLSVDECLTLLDYLITVAPRTFIVLDALDECQLPGGQRRRLLTELLNLQKTRDLRLFMTSRDNPDIAALFERSLSLRIRASAADVERFLRGQLENLPRVVQQKEDLQREVIAAITSSMDGMFLLAHLHIESIQGKRSAKQIREGLKTLPTGLDAAYVEAWSRIESQLPDQVQTAKDALSWISCATRPLTTLELVHARAIEEGLSYFDEENIPEIDDVVAACGGLVTVDEQEHVVRLVHYTAQEFLERHRDRLLPDAASDVGSKCIQYLSFDAFAGGTCWTFEEYDLRRRENPLFEYAAGNWGHYARENNIDMRTVLGLLRKQGNVNACYQLIISRPASWFNDLLWHGLRREFQNEMRGVHLAACHGLAEACLLLIDEDEGGNIDSTTDHEHTALWLAAQYGYPELVEILLEKGAFIEARETDKGCTPLYAAIRSNHAEVFHILANAGADMNAQSRYGKTPVSLAAELGLLTMSKLLLARGVDPNAVVQGEMTPLGHAARNGHEAVFRLLFETIGPERVRIHRRELLRDTAFGGNEAMLRLILDDDDLTPDEKAACALHALQGALTWANEETCRVLLAVDGVSVEGRYDEGLPLLSKAVSADDKSTTIIKLLLDEYGANPTTRDNNSRTPLSHAVCIDFRRCHNWEEAGAIIQLLLEREGVDVNSACDKGRTPLHYAILSRPQVRNDESDAMRVTLVRILLEHGAKVNLKDVDGETPLSYAAKLQLPVIVSMLLEQGARVDATDKRERTPLSHAVDPSFESEGGEPADWEKRVTETVQVLLDNGASAAIKDEDGLTPLARSRSRLPGHEVLALLEEAR
ncbi:ankyrin repeat-containing domain protein [Aspergillus stella-maris]|uniref:ankyrin repeat-containing domain protein n=1 Tax=Aspergillus stella-maris TaxID=1810926 RepID=UPI003CCC90AA